jgi:hypothetical protein
MSSTPLYCANHPKTQTLLRCIRCERPFCTKCLVRTPVGFRCRECLNIQQAGYYTALPGDYVIAGGIGIIASIIGGAMATLLSGLWLIAIFYAPFAGGVIAEIIRWAIQKRRGKYIWLVVCAAVCVGAFIGAGLFAVIALLPTRPSLLGLIVALLISPFVSLVNLANIGFLIYLVLAISTVYARLRV